MPRQETMRIRICQPTVGCATCVHGSSSSRAQSDSFQSPLLFLLGAVYSYSIRQCSMHQATYKRPVSLMFQPQHLIEMPSTWLSRQDSLPLHCRTLRTSGKHILEVGHVPNASWDPASPAMVGTGPITTGLTFKSSMNTSCNVILGQALHLCYHTEAVQLQDEHGIPKAIEAVPFLPGFLIHIQQNASTFVRVCMGGPNEGTDHKHGCGFWQM